MTEDSATSLLIDYYQQRLVVYEQFDFTTCSRESLLEIGREASSLQKVLLDCYEEDYNEIMDPIVSQTNALERLQQFLQQVLQSLGETSPRALFHLYPEVVELNLQPPYFTGETLELEVLLASLELHSQNPVDIRECFTDVQHMQHWQAKTALVLNEMLAFMIWTLQQLRRQPVGWVPVFLLRDTLFMYFGYRLLSRKGLLSVTPQPLLLNRKFLHVLEGNEDFFEVQLGDTLYQTLAERPQDATDFSKRFTQRLRQTTIPSSFQQETRAYLQRLVGSQPIFIIESGLHGTIPLWILSQCDNPGKFVLYTTAPWLYEVYDASIFHRNYNYLRDMETTVAQNFLFQFRAIEQQRVLVDKTGDPHIEKLALYELHHFRKLLEAADLSFLCKHDPT